jgi:hypothetical protein
LIPLSRREFALPAAVELSKPLVHIVDDWLQKNPIGGAADANAITGKPKIAGKADRLAAPILEKSSCLRICHIQPPAGIHQ